LRADVIRVELLDRPPEILEETGFQFTAEGASVRQAGGHAGGFEVFGPDGVARFTHESPPGSYGIEVYLPATPFAADGVEYALSEGSSLVVSVVLDQRPGGGRWITLGHYRLNGGPLELAIHPSEGGSMVVDSVRFVLDPPEFRQDELEVRPGAPHYRESGAWAPLGAERTTQTEHDAAIYNFAGLESGPYDVLVDYQPGPDNANAASYELTSGGAIVDTFVIDQRLAVAGNWRRIGAIFAPGPIISVRLSHDGVGLLRAGGVRLVAQGCAGCDHGEVP